MTQTLHTFLCNACHKYSFARDRQDTDHPPLSRLLLTLHFHSPHSLSKEKPLRSAGNFFFKRKWLLAGNGKRACHVIFPGAAHRACVSVCVCKMRSRENICALPLCSLTALEGRASRGTHFADAPSGGSQPACPARFFQGSGRRPRAPSLSSLCGFQSFIHSFDLSFIPNFYPPPLHWFTTTSPPPLFLPNVSDSGQLPAMN